MSKVDDLRRELAEAERVERMAKQRQKQAKEKTFKEDTKLNVYWASDYAGSSNDKYSFYYGYEHVFCPKHGYTDYTPHQHCQVEGIEWAFVAYEDDRAIAQYKQTELWHEDENPLFMLLAGVTKFTKDKPHED